MELAPLSIIIADDEKAHVEAIRRVLEKERDWGGRPAPRVTSVATLGEYREAVAACQPDLALMELNLPDGRALEVLPASAESCPFPILVMTSHGNEQTAVEALKAGALDYVVKSPESFAAMPRTMKRALREWQLHRERWRAEEALHVALEKYRVLFDSFPLGICVTDAGGEIVEINRESARLLGLSRDEQLNLSFDSPSWRIVRPDRSPMPPEEFASVRALREGRRVENVEMGIVGEGGAVTWLSVTAAPIPLEHYGVAIAYGDIGARKLGEERIEHLNRVLRAVRTVDRLIVREQDPVKLIQETCQLLVEHRGYVSALILLTDAQGKALEHAESGQGEAFRGLAQELRQGRVPACCHRPRQEPGVFQVRERSVVCACCSMYADCVRNDAMCIMLRHDGVLHGFMAVSLCQGQQIDQEELELFEELAGDVAFALHNIDQKRQRLKAQTERDRIEAELRQSQKMEAIGQLAGGIAHDFNNMLSVIMGFAQMGLAGLSPTDPMYQNLLQIEMAGARSAQLTRQLLTFSRKQVAQPRVINLNEAIAEQRKMLYRLIGEDLRIQLAPAPELWNILIDPSQVDQILTNLAVNARDAIGGVGIIAISTENVTLNREEGAELQLSPGDYVKLVFSDTGAGMDQPTRERIFEPFFTTKGEGKGTGLGLSTVYGIVKQNEGGIQVLSAPGMGTSFSIWFPRNLEQAAQWVEKSQENPLPGSETVLIVEDEEQILNLAQTVLRKHGYRVLAAASPERACEFCAACAGPIDLLLSDVVMPVMNGRELQLRVESLKPGIRTLFMSGYAEEVIAHRGVMEQGFQFLAKPFSVRSLVEKVREVLDA